MKERLLSYQQMNNAADMNIIACAALGYSIDMFIIDKIDQESVTENDIIRVLNVFTTTDVIIFDGCSYAFNGQVDTISTRLLKLYRHLSEERFGPITEIIEDDEYIGFKDYFGEVLKARKVGDNK